MATGANKTIWWDFDGTLVWRPFMWAEVGLRLIDRLCPGHGISADQLTDALASGMPWHRDNHAHPDLETPTLWWQAVYDRYAAVFSSVGCARVLAQEHLEALRTDILDASRYTLFDDAVPVLSRLHERGWRQIIVSNHVPELNSLMTGLGLAPYFAASVSSGVVGYEKPHQRLFEAALAETPPGSRIWMIGDNIDCDCRPVAAFGADAILVRNDDAAGQHGGLRAQDLHQALELLETWASDRTPNAL